MRSAEEAVRPGQFSYVRKLVDITYDEPERLANIAEHGFDFAEFETAFSLDRFVTLPAKASRTGRIRFTLIGTWKGATVVVAIVSSLRTQALSPVSIRHANASERPLMTKSDRAPGYVPNDAYSQEDWDEVSDNLELTDGHLKQLWPAKEVLPPELYDALVNRGGRPLAAERKVPVTIRLDPHVVDASKATGPGWQTRMN